MTGNKDENVKDVAGEGSKPVKGIGNVKSSSFIDTGFTLI